MDKPKVLAVDGDIVAYRTAAVCEDHFEGACEEIIDTTLTEIATDTGISKMRIYISGENNFRYTVATTKPYKGNRATMVRPKFLKHCKNYLVEKYSALVIHGYEADDAIASDMVLNGAYHCGIDKDMLQIAGRHYNYVNKEWKDVDEEEATLTLYRQILMGDSSDNIPGLPKVGVKTAEKIITDYLTAHEDAIEYYKDVCAEKLPDVKYQEYFFEQAALITMVKDIDILGLFTVHINPKTDGFQKQEGDEIEDSEYKPKPRAEKTKPKI
jgi:hypothetical protein